MKFISSNNLNEIWGKVKSLLSSHTNDTSVHTTDSTGQANKVWKTDANGNPAWRDDANTTYSNMTAATASAAGKAGLVPAPAAGKQDQYLRGDGTWATPLSSGGSSINYSSTEPTSIANGMTWIGSKGI